MSFKLTSGENKRLDLYIARLDTEWMAVQARVEDANDAIAQYNEILTEANAFLEDIHSEREGDYEDKSDKWKEGEAGNEAYEWLAAVQEAMTMAEMDQLDFPDRPDADLESFPREAGE